MEDSEEGTSINAQVAIICGMCNISRKVTSYCIDCKDLICTECRFSHDSMHIITDRNNKRLLKFVAEEVSSESVVCRWFCTSCKNNLNVFWKCKVCRYHLCDTCAVRHMASRRTTNHTIRKLAVKQTKRFEKKDETIYPEEKYEMEFQQVQESPPHVLGKSNSDIHITAVDKIYATDVKSGNKTADEKDLKVCSKTMFAGELRVQELILLVCIECECLCHKQCSVHNHAHCNNKIYLRKIHQKASKILEDRRKCLQLIYKCQRNIRNFIDFLTVTEIDKDIFKSQVTLEKEDITIAFQKDLAEQEIVKNRLLPDESHYEMILLEENVYLLASFFFKKYYSRTAETQMLYPSFETAHWNFYLHLDEIQAELLKKHNLDKMLSVMHNPRSEKHPSYFNFVVFIVLAAGIVSLAVYIGILLRI